MINYGFISKNEMQFVHIAPLGPIQFVGLQKQTHYLLNEAEGNR
ncbi:hypothetical protein [Bacillus sp. FJAT-28004]|nr:hypothetical protein [Bacillus sp. FJAT-28004]